MDDNESFRLEFDKLVKRVAALESQRQADATLDEESKERIAGLAARVKDLESKGVQTMTTDQLFAKKG